MMEDQDSDIEKIQQSVLEISKYFVAFCSEHSLTCYFCGGGCIGTIRNQGFIPWDDDLDFFMPRKDYEKLKKIWKKMANEERFPLLSASKGYIDHNSFTTIRDTQTTFIKTYQQELDIPHGIAIDIFPLDGAPTSNFKRKIQKLWAMVYALFCSQVIPQAKHGKMKVWVSKLLLGVFRGQKIRYYIWHFAEKQMTKYNFDQCELVTELCVGPKYMGNIYEQKNFQKAQYLPFEDTYMPVPNGYEAYLTQVFDDYMKLPDKQDRVTHHEAVFIDTNHSYKKYKGTYYCVHSLKEE